MSDKSSKKRDRLMCLFASQMRQAHMNNGVVSNKKVFLTIDDAPSADAFEKHKYLSDNNIPAIWFCIGKHIEEHRDVVIDMIKNGAVIANHSYSHADFATVDPSEGIEEIDKTDRIIDECYKAAGVERKEKFFRFPFGNRGYLSEEGKESSDEEKTRANLFQEHLKARGYKTPSKANISYDNYKKLVGDDTHDVYWTYDVMEWVLRGQVQVNGVKDIEDVYQLMDVDMPQKWLGLNTPDSDDIILIHDHEETTKYFQDIIERLKSKGLQFCALTEIDRDQGGEQV